MNPVYIKIEYEEAKSSKKQLLIAQANLLNLMKRLSNYKFLRKKELAKKAELKNSIIEMKTSVRKINLEQPQLTEKEEYAETKLQLNKKMSIEAELTEIKRKLEKLS